MNRRHELLMSICYRLLERATLPVRALFVGSVMLLGASNIASAALISDVRNTSHNLSVTGTGAIKATSETQVCVFCHTPHNATQAIVAPLWNRQLSSATYTTYTSTSLDANAAEIAAGPGGSSKLCLSCHDGTLAIGSVNVLNGVSTAIIAMTGTSAGGKINLLSGESTGFTRKIGADLSNDHPISFTYDDTLAAADGELRPITGQSAVGTRVPGNNPKPQYPLENGQVQCNTCHDPHLRQTDTSMGNNQYLRGNRFQQAAPSGGEYDKAKDIICLACHKRGGLAWANSSHANPLVTTQTYLPAAATLREFPANMPVWKGACLNCHDDHAAPGARRLLREGNESTTTPKGAGAPSIEQTCYQCHSALGKSAITPLITVPDLEGESNLPIRMALNNADQGVTTEAHDIGTSGLPQGGKDFTESRTQLGAGNLNNRHAECTDCHNPHRNVKNYRFYGNAGNTSIPDAAGTHPHTDVSGASGTKHDNIISGTMRGTFGVEPIYASNSFHTMPVSFTVKRGDPGLSVSTLVTESYVTREYQICLKCHSNYGYDDNNIYPIGNRPTLGGVGSTASGSNGLTMHTNQAKEFQAPVTHQGEIGKNLGADGGANAGNTAAFNTENHRSWHPVMARTGRTPAERGMGTDTSVFLPPWNNDVGNQTMYCSDCHGHNTGVTTSVIPNGGANGNPWGPHGSNLPFMLKGVWVNTTSRTTDMLCFKCHDKADYSDSGSSRSKSGFKGAGFNNLHVFHADKVNKLRCTWCHVAVPHGWKNKQLLVNLNDVGEEAGYPGMSKEVSIKNDGEHYSKEPYYFKAVNKIYNFAVSGTWQASDCSSRNKAAGDRINGSAGSNNDGTGPGGGKDWMKNVCNNPP